MLSRGRSFWRRLPPEFGDAPLKVTPDAALSFLRPGPSSFDPMLFRLCDNYVISGQSVWDVGANVGIFALAAARRGARVLAIEPDPWLYSLLCATKDHRKNQACVLEPLCVAIAAAAGTADLAIARRGRASNFLQDFSGRSDAGGVRETRLVPVLSLDLLLSGHDPPALVKVDVEGAEAAVLSGSRKLLSEVRPTILIEVGRSTRANVIETLASADYQVFDYETGAVCDRDSVVGTNLLGRPN
jgi:FkbM family methyltransferase